MEEFFERLRGIDHVDDQIDHIFGYFNVRLNARKFDECDEVLKNVKVDDWNANIIVAFLTITNSVRDEMNHRVDFIERSKEFLGRPKLFDGFE